MSDTTRAALAQALEALQDAESSLSDYQQDVPFGGYDARTIDCVRAAIAAAEAALATAQEPVAWVYHGIGHNGDPHKSPSLIWRPEYMDAMSASKGATAIPLYAAPTAPARAEPTDEQIKLLDPWMRPAAAKELLTQVLALRDGGAA